MKRIDDRFAFFLHEKGEAVQINGVSRTAVITEAPRGADYYFNDCYIRTGEVIHTGDVVTRQARKWLVISQVDEDRHSFQAKMRLCNHLTKFVLEDWAYGFESILDVGIFGISQGRIIPIVDGSLTCELQANALTKQIYINQRFLASDSAWVITGIDKTRPGIFILHADRTVFVTGDDEANEIANADRIPDWHIVMSDTAFDVEPDGTYQLAAHLYKTDVVEPAALLWQSSDEGVATVSGTGLVTGVALGTATITAIWAKHPAITASSEATVAEAAPPVTTYRFYSSDGSGANKSYINFDVTQYSSRIMGIEKLINGEPVTNDTYAFVLTPNGVSPSAYTYTVVNGYSVKIECWAYAANAMTLKGTSNQSGEMLQVAVRLSSW